MTYGMTIKWKKMLKILVSGRFREARRSPSQSASTAHITGARGQMQVHTIHPKVLFLTLILRFFKIIIINVS